MISLKSQRGAQITTYERMCELDDKKTCVLRCAGDVCARTPAVLIMKYSVGRFRKELEKGAFYEYKHVSKMK